MYLKVKSDNEFLEMLSRGYKTAFSQGKWYLRKGNRQLFIPAHIRDNHTDILVHQIDRTPEEQPIDTPTIPLELTEPTVPLPPEEYVCHDALVDIIEQIASNEGLHQVSNDDKHELPFAQSKGENKFSPKSSGEVMLSLHDVVIYFLMDIYKEYHGIEDKLALLRLERTAVEMQSKQIDEAVNAFDNLIIERSLSQPPEIVMEQIDTRIPMMVEA